MNPPDFTDPNGSKSPKDELRDLCDRLLDGEFTAGHRARLETLVLGNPELRRLYVEILHQHAALRQSATRLGDVPLGDILEMSPTSAPAPLTQPFPRWPLQLAAGLALAVTIWLFAPRPTEKPLATLVETNGARWDNSSLPTAPGSALRAGRLRLESGVARLVFRSGAEVSLEGPAELEIQGPNACFLHNGALTAHVPPQAHGFLVATAHAQLIDHGTDFGVSAGPDGQGQVQVLKGEVELRHETSGETRRLTVHQSATITAAHLAEAGGTAEGEPDRYAFLRPDGALRPPTLTLTTAGGTGDAAYVVSPDSPIHRSETLLLVKNAPTTHYLRKAYLGFDLTPLRRRHVADASLSLNFESTGFGYASLTDACTFAVYGLTDPAQDGWTVETLTWENAPAFASGGGAVDPAKAVKLGTFTTPRGVVSGTFSIAGQPLADFLNAATGPRATLIVIRETALPGNDTAVHGFAGNHHPTLAPPTLRMTLEDR
jgi:hypothetical protein